MSGEHDTLAAPDTAREPGPAAGPSPGQPPGQPSTMTINGMPVYIAAPPPPPLRERLRTLRADFKTWLAGAAGPVGTAGSRSGGVLTITRPSRRGQWPALP